MDSERPNGNATEDKARKTALDALSRLGARLLRCVLPIVRPSGNTFTRLGTATLFAIGDEKLLVTAKHVATDASKCSSGVFLAPPVPAHGAVKLTGQVHLRGDPYDLAVSKVDHPTALALGDVDYLRLTDVDLHASPDPSACYYLLGYPTNWELRRGPTDKIPVYCTCSFEGEAGIAGYDRAKHLLLEVPRENNVDLQGGKLSMPESLMGMSGCSILQSRNPMDVDTCKVVAVQTGEVRKREVVKATMWRYVAHMIWQHVPCLRRALKANPQWPPPG